MKFLNNQSNRTFNNSTNFHQNPYDRDISQKKCYTQTDTQTEKGVKARLEFYNFHQNPYDRDISQNKTRGQRPNESQKAVIIYMMKSVGECALLGCTLVPSMKCVGEIASEI